MTGVLLLAALVYWAMRSPRLPALQTLSLHGSGDPQVALQSAHGLHEHFQRGHRFQERRHVGARSVFQAVLVLTGSLRQRQGGVEGHLCHDSFINT